MPRHVPRRGLHAARAAGLFFLRPHRHDSTPPTPPAPPATLTAATGPRPRHVFDPLGRVTTFVYDVGCFVIPSGNISTTWYDASRPPAPLATVTTYVYDPVAGTARRPGQDAGLG